MEGSHEAHEGGDEVYRRAAKAIKEGTFLLVGAGAGMSADSGLPVYGDVSKLEFFQRTKLDYRDVCDPSLLIKNPERYFGWAALNISKYRAARPHAGYDLLRRWRDDLYPAQQQQGPGTDELVRTLHAKLRDPTSIRSLEGLGVSALPGRTFVFTTNVDGFFLRAGFHPEEVFQAHGTYERVQCAGLKREGSKSPAFKHFDGPCCQKTWEVPQDYAMEYDELNMSAPAGAPRSSPTSVDPTHWGNHATCSHCGKLARSNIYGFGDYCFIENEQESALFMNWCQAVQQMVKDDPKASVVLLEIGVGLRLPKVRVHFERMVKELPEGRATIVRVNPTPVDCDPATTASVIHIYDGTLTALQKIDAMLHE